MNQSGLSQASSGQSLRTSPAALDRAGTQLDALVETLRQALANATDGCATATAGATTDGWTTTPAMQHVITASLATLNAVADLAGRTATGLHASAREYQRTDERAAAW